MKLPWMNFEERPRKLVFVEKKTETDTLFDHGRCVWYECPECGARYDWLGRNNRGQFCTGCGNFLSWAKLDLENYKESVKDFDKKMTLHEFMENPIYGHTWEKEISMTYSHSEKEILDGCISLLWEMCDYFKEYLEFIDFEPSCEEEKFSFTMSYFHIVQRLFLWHTMHSGGTSTGMKMKKLGCPDEWGVTFNFDEEGEDEDESE